MARRAPKTRRLAAVGEEGVVPLHPAEVKSTGGRSCYVTMVGPSISRHLAVQTSNDPTHPGGQGLCQQCSH